MIAAIVVVSGCIAFASMLVTTITWRRILRARELADYAFASFIAGEMLKADTIIVCRDGKAYNLSRRNMPIDVAMEAAK